MGRTNKENYIYLGKTEYPGVHCSYEMIGPKDVKNNDLTQISWCMKDGECTRGKRPCKIILYKNFYK